MAIVRPATPLDVFSDVALPRWARYRQYLEDDSIVSIPDAVAQAFQRPEVTAAIAPGARVALTAGSRGIDRIAEVLKAAVTEVKRLGGEPFVFPAMGSHGGATAEGQLALIHHYGVTEDYIGCPIRASMDTVHLGEIDGGVPVWVDRIAYEQADVVIPVGRVKPHTDFRGPVESGLAKMIAIGMGKQHGASWFHSQGIGTFGELIPRVATFTLSQVNIPFGLALVENGLSKLAIIEAVPTEGMFEREAELLEIAKARLARLPHIPFADVLIVDKIGKDISGDGADPNVINRDVSGELLKSEIVPKPEVHRVIFRDLTPDTEGNATGVGLGDFVLRQLADKIDPVFTYMNVITSKYPGGGRLPMVIDNDRQAIYLAIGSAMHTTTETARIARIRNTKDVEGLWISEPLVPEMLATGKVELLGEPQEMAFDANGMLPAF